MKREDKEEIINLYENRLKEYGETVQTVGWRDKKQQELRFQILSQIGQLDGTNILDIGCGFGDFYDFLTERDIKVNYSGFDISPGMIKVARKHHPELKFEVNDILSEEIGGSFDYVFASGILNKNLSDNIDYAKKIIKKMYSLSNIGVGINMTTDYVDYKEESLYYYSPEKMFKFCRGIGKYVTLRHDYPLYEFTLYLFKKNRYEYHR